MLLALRTVLNAGPFLLPSVRKRSAVKDNTVPYSLSFPFIVPISLSNIIYLQTYTVKTNSKPQRPKY